MLTGLTWSCNELADLIYSLRLTREKLDGLGLKRSNEVIAPLKLDHPEDDAELHGHQVAIAQLRNAVLMIGILLWFDGGNRLTDAQRNGLGSVRSTVEDLVSELEENLLTTRYSIAA
jgi:hypothetical protein